ncbi:MAG: MCE family protein [bacterium]|nr:MCE family protein [bacterium]
MTRQTRAAWIGAFVVGFVLLAVGAVVAFGGGALFQEKHEFVLFFEDPLKGLQVGAPVLWRGVQIGSVRQIKITCDLETFGIRTPVYIETIDDRIRGPSGEHDPFGPNALELLLERGLRASLTSQSLLTGQKSITLDFHPDTPVRLTGGDPNSVELPTIGSGSGGLLGSVKIEPVMETAQAALQGIAELARSEDLARSIRNLADALDEFRKLGATLNDRAGPLVDDIMETAKSARATLDDIRATSASARELIADVQLTSGAARKTFDQATTSVRGIGDSVTTAATDLSKTLGDVSRVGGAIEAAVQPLTDSVATTLDRARLALDEVGSAMRSMRGLTSDNSRTVTNLNVALRAIADAVRAVERLAKTLERQPEALIRGK